MCLCHWNEDKDTALFVKCFETHSWQTERLLLNTNATLTVLFFHLVLAPVTYLCSPASCYSRNQLFIFRTRTLFPNSCRDVGPSCGWWVIMQLCSPSRAGRSPATLAASQPNGNDSEDAPELHHRGGIPLYLQDSQPVPYQQEKPSWELYRQCRK